MWNEIKDYLLPPSYDQIEKEYYESARFMQEYPNNPVYLLYELLIIAAVIFSLYHIHKEYMIVKNRKRRQKIKSVL